jgi:hypothetical protein
MAINLIVASEPIVESRLSKQEANNGRVTLDALCYRAVSACLEGRRDQACHFLLREHVDMPMLYEKARALDSKCRVAIARSKTSFLATSASLELQQDHTVQLSGDLDNLAKLWTIHSELFPEVRTMTRVKKDKGAMMNNDGTDKSQCQLDQREKSILIHSFLTHTLSLSLSYTHTLLPSSDVGSTVSSASDWSIERPGQDLESGHWR